MSCPMTIEERKAYLSLIQSNAVTFIEDMIKTHGVSKFTHSVSAN